MFRFAFALLLLSVVAPSAHAQTTVFTDAAFVAADWTVTTEVLNLGGSSSAALVSSGGNPGAYRRITTTLNSAVGQSFSNSVFSFHARGTALFDPSTTGAIVSIDYAEGSIHTSGGVQACGIALKQGGVIYYGPIFLNPTTLNVWATTTQNALVASNFDALAAGVQNPDFSTSGGPIQFGFFRANSTSVGGNGSVNTGGIDNWSVTVNYDQATPALSTTWGAIKASYAGR